MKEIKNNSRRDFLKKSGMLIGATVAFVPLASLLNSCEKDQLLPVEKPKEAPSGGKYPGYPIDLSQFPALLTTGGNGIMPIASFSASQKFFIKRMVKSTDEVADFIVLDSKCTHLGAVLEAPSDSIGPLKCSLHAVLFSTTADTKGTVVPGSNPSGYPVTPLKSYVCNFDKDTSKLYVQLS